MAFFGWEILAAQYLGKLQRICKHLQFYVDIQVQRAQIFYRNFVYKYFRSTVWGFSGQNTSKAQQNKAKLTKLYNM